VEAGIDNLMDEIARLEAEEARLSAERNRLQDKIDFGFGNDATRERERKVSDERQLLHQRIEELRQQLRSRQLT
jgi:hypothetical protein